MTAYWVTAVVIGLHTIQHRIKADSPGEAKRLFEAKYPGRSFVHTKCKRAGA